MKILINCSNLKKGGGIQVAHSFLNEIVLSEESYVVVLSSELNKQINKSLFKDNFVFYIYDIKGTPVNSLLGKNNFLDGIVEKHEIDRVFTVFGPAYWRPKVLHVCGYAKPHYVYTQSPFFKKITYKDYVILKLKELFHLYDFKFNSSVLISENPDVSSRITKRLKKKTYTVSNNYNQIFDKNDEWGDMVLPKFNGVYLLTISVNYPHKNLDIIPKVIQELKRRGIEKYKFVVTLDEGMLSNDEEVNKSIVYLGKIDVKDCPRLYEQCKYMFLPTLLECFSASYAEAMRMERVILTSDLGFAKGICVNSAVYFDPLKEEDIVDKLIELDNDKERYRELISLGKKRLKDFDTSSMRAKKYLEIIKK